MIDQRPLFEEWFRLTVGGLDKPAETYLERRQDGKYADLNMQWMWAAFLAGYNVNQQIHLEMIKAASEALSR